MVEPAEVLRRTAQALSPHRDALVEAWSLALREASGAPEAEVRGYCAHSLDALLPRLARGEVEDVLRAESEAVSHAARSGVSLGPLAAAVRVFDRCCLPFLLAALPDREELAQALVALHELGARRLEILVGELDEESHRRVIDAQEQAAGEQERARLLARANEALRQAESRSEHRAGQIALFANVAHRVTPILET